MPSPRIVFAAVVLLSVSACGDQTPATDATSASGTTSTSNTVGDTSRRWYEPARVERGAKVYAETCAACHGKAAEGASGWRKRAADGRLPPPPLNGTGHAWHHPFTVLASQIKFGAPGGQGSMPALGDTVTDEQIIDVIAWFQSHWNDAIYASWMQREQQYQARQK